MTFHEQITNDALMLYDKDTLPRSKIEFIQRELLATDEKYDSLFTRYQKLEKELEALEADKSQWHDLEKDPTDLPKDDKKYLVLFYYNYKGKKEMVYDIRDNLHRDFEIKRCYTEQIIAWCEIPTFDKE